MSGEVAQMATGQVDRRWVDKHAKLLVGTGDHGREPVHRELHRFAQPATTGPHRQVGKGFTCSDSCAYRVRGSCTRCTSQSWKGRHTTACRALPRRTKSRCGFRSRSSLSSRLSGANCRRVEEFNAVSRLV